MDKLWMRTFSSRELFCAWVAGFFDGEGCIMVNRHGPRKQHYNLKTEILQVASLPIELIVDEFGGSYGKLPQRGKGLAPINYVHHSGEMALELLRSIRPYTIVKSQEIDTVLDWPSMTRGPNQDNEKARLERSLILTRLRDIRTERRVIAQQEFLECR